MLWLRMEINWFILNLFDFYRSYLHKKWSKLWEMYAVKPALFIEFLISFLSKIIIYLVLNH